MIFSTLIDLLDLLKDALPLVVALLTILSAGIGIGLWLGILTTQQKQTKSELQRLREDFEKMVNSRRAANRTLSEEFREFQREISENR